MPDLWLDVDAALSEVPINLIALTDDTDFKTREESVTYDQSGLDLVWNFVTTAGAMTQTAVTPTDTGGAHDWVSQGNGLYTIEIPASSGTINNDTEGFGWFTGFATGVLPWRGPVIGFRAATLNNALIDLGTNIAGGLPTGKQGYNAITTTVNVVTNQQAMTFNAGPGDNNALLDHVVVFEDADGDVSRSITMTGWTGSTKAGTWGSNPTFTVVSTDTAYFYPISPADSTDALVTAVWAALRASHTASNSFGAGVLVEDLNTAAKASVNTEVDGALDTNIPSATAGSINERVKAIDDKLPSGTISDFNTSTDGVNVSQTNSATVVGDGNATPWDGA